VEAEWETSESDSQSDKDELMPDLFTDDDSVMEGTPVPAIIRHTDAPEPNSYEREREANIARRKAYMQELGLDKTTGITGGSSPPHCVVLPVFQFRWYMC